MSKTKTDESKTNRTADLEASLQRACHLIWSLYRMLPGTRGGTRGEAIKYLKEVGSVLGEAQMDALEKQWRAGS